MKNDKTQQELFGENEELRIRLQEAEETLQAIREGSVDALVVQGPGGDRVFTLTGEDTVYRRLVETMSEAGLTTTPEGQILFCNERFGKMLGRPMEDILGHKLNEFVGQSYLKAIPSLLARAKAKPARVRLVFTAADGTPVPVRVSANLLQQGNSMNICIVAMDLTELEASEEIIHQINEQRAALQTSEERYRALVESSPDAVIVHRKGQFLFANSVALELYGAGTLEELQTKTILDLTAPEERPIVKQRINVIEKGGKTPLRETKILRLDGKTIPVEATAASIYFEGVPAAQVILRDIRERKQAQQAIEDAHNQAIHDKNRLEAMMDALPIGVAILDAKGGNTRSNKMFEETWSGPRPPANDIKDYVHYQAWWTDSGKPVKPHEWASAQAVLTGKTVSNQVFEIRRFDGSHAFVLNSAAPIRDADGHITGCAVAIRDITELRKAEDALAAAHRRTQNIIDNTTAIVYAFDLEGRFVVANAAVAKLLNSTPAQMIGKRRHDFMPQTDADWHEANDRKVIEADQALDFEEHSELPGRRITWLTTKFPLRDAEGKIYAVGGFSTDISQRKRAEEAVKDSEARYRRLFEAARDGILILDADSGQIVDVNPFIKDISGYSHEELLKKKLWEIGLFKDIASSKDSFQELQSKGYVRYENMPLETKDGRHIAVEFVSNVYLVDQKKVIQCNIRDITARVQAEETNRRHSATLAGINKVLEAALTCQTERDLGVVCLTIAQELTQSKFGFIGQMNEKGLEDIAISNPGWDACTVIDPDGHCNRGGSNFKIHGIFGRVISEGKAFFTNDPANHPDRIGLPDGHPPLEAFLGVPLIRESRVIGLIAVANRPGGYTQTEQETLETLAPVIVEAFLRKRAEQELETHRRHLEEMVQERTTALRRSQELLNETQRISKIGGWELDVITRRVFWTDEVYRIHGVSKDYDPGSVEQDIQFYSPQDQIRLTEALQRAETDGQPFDLELQLRTAKGNLLWVRIMGQAESKDGKVVRLSGSIMDIAERKKVEAQLAEKNAEIQNRAHQLSLLASQLFTTEQRERRRLAQVLHDHLQQLLVAAKFELNSMARQPGSREHQDSITRVTDLIKQSIQESRSLTVELSPPVLHEDGLHAGLEWLARWIEEKHHLKVHLTLDSRTNIQYEQINVLLFQCVRELLFNIVKHSQVKEARVSLEMDEKSISVTVCDEGKGFDVEKMWANAAKTTGFGLFSIRERLHIIDGKMSVESQPGKGSTFVLTLRLPEMEKHPQIRIDDQMTQPSKATGIPPVPREKGKLRILLVDDHAVVRRGLSLLLKQESDIKIVGEAGSGKEAVTLARDLKPDIILMDYGMPKMNGADATREIHSQFPNIRIIGLSMHEKADRADAMFKAGASAYLSKSESSDKLLSTIRQMSDQACGMNT